MRPPAYSLEDMPRGITLLTSGNIDKAAVTFQGIIDAMEGTAPAEVYQQLGICLRMIADRSKYKEWLYSQADKAFKLAARRAKTDFHRGQVFRDWAMVALGRRRYDLAHGRLEGSSVLLRQSTDEEISTPEKRDIELNTTRGFVARVYYASGDRRQARRLFQEMDRKLYDTPPYELNNRVWSFKVAPLGYRLRWAPRTLRLALQDRNWKRFWQIVGLVVCRPLAIRIGG